MHERSSDALFRYLGHPSGAPNSIEKHLGVLRAGPPDWLFGSGIPSLDFIMFILDFRLLKTTDLTLGGYEEQTSHEIKARCSGCRAAHLTLVVGGSQHHRLLL